MRRSLSMFEHPAEVMKPKPEEVAKPAPAPVVPGAAEPEAAQEPSLPHFRADDPTDSIPRISQATLLEVLDGKYSQDFDQKMIIDCRFEYEYDGGHIDGAVNYNDKELLAKQLFQTPMSGRTLIVFHCEYSAHRAPLMARHIRSEDRTANAEHYPRLTYPEVYILDGGYSGFYAEHRGRCSPQEYIEMSDERHQRTCEREMGRLKARKPFGRAQTFAAFGERQRCVRELPTIKEPKRCIKEMPLFAESKSSIPEIPSSPPRITARLDPVAMIGNSPILGERQSSRRRMASY
jgi:M-phase inducer tyrosine phosphatase